MSMLKTTQSTRNAIVWQTFGSFRGTIDESDYKDYVLTMFFIKCLSDFHKQKLKILTQVYKGIKNV